MTENIRPEGFQCGDEAALASYLYEECEPAEALAIAAHLAGCKSCAGELEALRATRAQLAAWVPPEAPLNFRITTAADPVVIAGAFGHDREPRQVVWWRRPLPAWAQLAAAAAIFAVGVTVGGARTAPSAPVVASPVAGRELASLEQRVRELERGVPVAVPAADPRPVRVGPSMAEVRHEIGETGDQIRQEVAVQLVNMVNETHQQLSAQQQRFDYKLQQVPLLMTVAAAANPQ